MEHSWIFYFCHRAPGGELFDYLTRVVTIPEKETRWFFNYIHHWVTSYKLSEIWPLVDLEHSYWHASQFVSSVCLVCVDALLCYYLFWIIFTHNSLPITHHWRLCHAKGKAVGIVFIYLDIHADVHMICFVLLKHFLYHEISKYLNM